GRSASRSRPRASRSTRRSAISTTSSVGTARSCCAHVPARSPAHCSIRSRGSSSTSSIRRSKPRWRSSALVSRIAFVVAIGRDHVIGKGGALPWRLPDDMKHVREVTMGKPMIMGRRTYDSIGKPLPGRTSIVLTSDPTFHPDGVLVARTPDEALALAGNAPETIVFGGAGVFKAFMPLVDRVYLTEVHAEIPDA